MFNRSNQTSLTLYEVPKETSENIITRKMLNLKMNIILNSFSDYMKNQNNDIKAYVNFLACELREMDPIQIIIAKKQISNILYQARMGNLQP